jgi:hypothetical protein
VPSSTAPWLVPGALTAIGAATAIGLLGQRKYRRDPLPAIARRHGLSVGPVDPYGSATLLFDRFNAGIDRRIRHWNTCAAGTLPLWTPYAVIGPETMLTRLLATATGNDIEIESEEFNRRYHVRCDSRRFATLLLCPEMIEVLLAADGEVTLETHGNTFCLTCVRLPTSDLAKLLGYAAAVRAALPERLAELFVPEPPR